VIIAYLRIRKWIVWPLSYIGAFVPGARYITDPIIRKYGFVVR